MRSNFLESNQYAGHQISAIKRFHHMKSDQQFEEWRSGEMVKLLLLSSGFARVVPDPENKFDFVALSEKLPGRLLAVEVKASAHPQTQLRAWTQKFQQQLSSDVPALLALVDSKNEEGFFLLGLGPQTGPQPLTKPALEQAFHLLAA